MIMCLNFKKSKKIKIQSYIGVRMVNNTYQVISIFVPKCISLQSEETYMY